MSGIIGSVGSKSGVIGETELDYETGTWIVTCQNSVSLYADYRTGAYTKIGRMVTCGGQIRIDNSQGGADLIIHLPFTSAPTSAQQSDFYTCSVRAYTLNINSDVLYVMGFVSASTTQMQIVGVRDNLSATVQPATNNAYIMFSMTYPVAE